MESNSVQRNWGTYRVLDEGAEYRVKELCIDPMQSLSNQYHDHRDEVWNVVEGRVHILINKVGNTNEPLLVVLNEQDSYRIPKKHWHQAFNPDLDKPAKVVEIWFGSYLDEDDITREH